MPVHAYESAAWQECRDIHVYDGGWERVARTFAYESGAWRQCHGFFWDGDTAFSDFETSSPGANCSLTFNPDGSCDYDTNQDIGTMTAWWLGQPYTNIGVGVYIRFNTTSGELDSGNEDTWLQLDVAKAFNVRDADPASAPNPGSSWAGSVQFSFDNGVTIAFEQTDVTMDASYFEF